MIYIYDGSFKGLLTCLYHALQSKRDVEDFIPEHRYEQLLLQEQQHIATEKEAVQKMKAVLREKLPSRAYHHIFNAFLSSAKQKEKMIYEYIVFGLTIGKRLDFFLGDDRVRAIHAISRKVGFEAYRMQGFVRFRQLKDGIYYAGIDTDHCILPLIIKHFTRRFTDFPWIIHDTKRKKALFYNRKTWAIADLSVTATIEYSAQEQESQALWKRYFNRISIEERKNPKLQRQHVPMRYRKNLNEFDN